MTKLAIRSVAILLSILVFVGSSAAFIYELKTLDKKQIAKLSDEELIDAYLEVLIEFKASSMFHQTSGFTPQDYEKYKALFRYRIYLGEELKKRELDVPVIDL